MASDHFQVHIKDLAGQSVTVQCTSDTPVSYLISQFRDNISPMYKRHLILLLKDDRSEVELNGTLKSNGIEHDTNLFAIYKFWVSCINPEPIAGHLHHWIENNIRTFKPKFNPKIPPPPTWVKTADCTDFFKQYNKWENGKHSFFLTAAQMGQFDMITTVESITDNIELISIGYKSELSKPLKSKSNKTSAYVEQTSAYVEYRPNELGQLTRQLMANDIFVRGNLDRVQITINQKKGTQGRTFDRGFEIYVILKGPIEICKPNGDIQYSSNNSDAECKIPYDYIEMCSSPAEFYMSNNTQGGRRVKRTKRTQKKRKTQRRTHKKRA